jgi:hypothetical protein
MRQRGEALLPASIVRRFVSQFFTGRAATGLRRLRGEEGNLVEYSGIIILLLTMLLGIGDFGHALYAYHFVSHAAREATRWAAVNGYCCGSNCAGGDGSCNGQNGMNNGPASSTDIQNYVKNLASSGVDASKLTVSASWPVQTNSPQLCSSPVNGTSPQQNYPGCTVEVQVSYNVDLLLPLPGMGPMTLSSRSQMVIAH